MRRIARTVWATWGGAVLSRESMELMRATIRRLAVDEVEVADYRVDPVIAGERFDFSLDVDGTATRARELADGMVARAYRDAVARLGAGAVAR